MAFLRNQLTQEQRMDDAWASILGIGLLFLILEKGRKEIHNTLWVWPTWRGQYDPDVGKDWEVAKPEAGDVGTTTLW